MPISLPTLSGGPNITDPEAAIVAFMQYYASAMASSQGSFRDIAVSLVKTVAMHGRDRDVTAAVATQDVQNAIDRLFSGGENVVSVIAEVIDPDTATYALIFRITVQYEGRVVIITDRVTVDPDRRLIIADPLTMGDLTS